MALSWVFGASFCLFDVGWGWCFGVVVGYRIVGGFDCGIVEDGLRVVAAWSWF